MHIGMYINTITPQQTPEMTEKASIILLDLNKTIQIKKDCI